MHLTTLLDANHYLLSVIAFTY